MALTDLSFIQQFTGNDPAKAKKYITMFLTSAPLLVHKMEESLASGDFDTLRINAHSLKPLISYMGIASLEQPIKDIESYAASKSDTNALPQMLESFKLQIGKAIEELKVKEASL
ncbi:MAG: Hpt domain-containing protein [Bacteroidota bacterium]|nr:Hpt domain-containing protein [Bacteroidota bacterium]